MTNRLFVNDYNKYVMPIFYNINNYIAHIIVSSQARKSEDYI
jgi:hypothetical protein